MIDITGINKLLDDLSFHVNVHMTHSTVPIDDTKAQKLISDIRDKVNGIVKERDNDEIRY